MALLQKKKVNLYIEKKFVKIPGITLILFVQLRKIGRCRKIKLILMNLTTEENTASYSYCHINGMSSRY